MIWCAALSCSRSLTHGTRLDGLCMAPLVGHHGRTNALQNVSRHTAPFFFPRVFHSLYFTRSLFLFAAHRPIDWLTDWLTDWRMMRSYLSCSWISQRLTFNQPLMPWQMQGGAIYMDGGTATLTSCTFSNNQAVISFCLVFLLFCFLDLVSFLAY